MKRLHVFFPVPILAKLREMATASDISVAEIIRRAVEAYLRKQSRRAAPE